MAHVRSASAEAGAAALSWATCSEVPQAVITPLATNNAEVSFDRIATCKSQTAESMLTKQIHRESSSLGKRRRPYRNSHQSEKTARKASQSQPSKSKPEGDETTMTASKKNDQLLRATLGEPIAVAPRSHMIAYPSWPKPTTDLVEKKGEERIRLDCVTSINRCNEEFFRTKVTGPEAKRLWQMQFRDVAQAEAKAGSLDFRPSTLASSYEGNSFWEQKTAV